jgi:hypothetical protein
MLVRTLNLFEWVSCKYIVILTDLIHGSTFVFKYNVHIMVNVHRVTVY